MEPRMNVDPVALVEDKLFNELVDSKPFDLTDQVRSIANRHYEENTGKVKKKKDKNAYRLYPLYNATKQILKECEPTATEMGEFVNGEVQLSETAKILISKHSEEKEAIETLVRSQFEINQGLDECKASWIKDKVIQGRYSAKGHRYTEMLSQLNDAALSQAALVIGIINTMGNMLKGTGELDG